MGRPKPNQTLIKTNEKLKWLKEERKRLIARLRGGHDSAFGNSACEGLHGRAELAHCSRRVEDRLKLKDSPDDGARRRDDDTMEGERRHGRFSFTMTNEERENATKTGDIDYTLQPWQRCGWRAWAAARVLSKGEDEV
ncbi:hypothetical protein Csa_018463 [Cucumis sativus]|uniref:Uncharacterized protein n=1 Tax=Cucumis sativus TaxID=3659 RepID=A0A0A0KIY8_CUCSA|nr:hypothetical protein Csa_018463 [Cucumis sativus]